MSGASETGNDLLVPVLAPVSSKCVVGIRTDDCYFASCMQRSFIPASCFTKQFPDPVFVWSVITKVIDLYSVAPLAEATAASNATAILLNANSRGHATVLH